MLKSIRHDHVAIYIRWSTEDQSEGTTLEVQTEGCRHYALSQGWTPQDHLTFVDDGYTGSNLHRPALTRLRELVKAGAVDCVVVFKVDRLSRNIVDAVDLVLNEWQDFCFFKSAREPIDTSTDLGRVVFGILAMFADFERSQIRDRTQSGKIKRIAEGRQLHGEPAYGYRPAGRKGQWEEDPVEAPIVRRMFNLVAGGASANSVCKLLNAETVFTRAGKYWSNHGLLWILHNRLYCGEAVYGATAPRPGRKTAGRGKHARVVRDKPLVEVQTEAAPALVSRETFEQVQRQLEVKRIARRQYGSRSLGSRNLLVGLTRCRCGGAVVAKVDKNGYTQYLCSYTRVGRCEHKPGHISQIKADDLITQQFAELFCTEAAKEARLLKAAGETQSDLANLQAQRAGLERERTQLDDQEQRLLRAARLGQVELKDLRDLRAAVEADRAALEKRRNSLDTLVEQAKGKAQEVSRILQLLPTADQITVMTTEEKRELLRAALAGPIIMYKAKGDKVIEMDVPWAF